MTGVCLFVRKKDFILVKRSDEEKTVSIQLSARVMRAFRSSSTFSVLKNMSTGAEVKQSIWVLRKQRGYLLRTCEKDVFLFLCTVGEYFGVIYMRMTSDGFKSMFVFSPNDFLNLMTNELFMLPEKMKYRRARTFY
jgi:hypothetical protein